MSESIELLVCPHCKKKLSDTAKKLFCRKCKKSFSRKNGLIDFLPESKKQELYEMVHSKKDPYFLEKNKGIALSGHNQKQKILEEIFSRIGLKDKILLDIGSGPKINPILLECKTGIIHDISRNALNQSLSSNNSKKFSFVLADENLPVKENSIDVVFCGEVIEHSENPDHLLEECSRVLKPKGKLVLTTPNKRALLFLLTFMEYGKDKQHISLQSFESMNALLGKKFAVLGSFGFNQSIWHYVDRKIRSTIIVDWWAKRFKKKPWLATGIIFECEKKE